MLALFLQVVLLGSYQYEISYSPDTLGRTNYPLDDTKGIRTIQLSTMKGQLPISWMHEKVHACFHDHPHQYTDVKELNKHLHEQTYTEEEVATILAPCLLQAQNVELRNSVK